MNKNQFNPIDCCFDCSKQFDDDLCETYCHNKESCIQEKCTPGSCQSFKSKTDIVISKKEYEELLEYKQMYLDLCK